jgi:RNA polymerase sigma-70 factor (ECF subfamily)
MNMGRIYALSLRLMGNKPEAEKLTANVFISAWKNLKSIRSDTPFALWLMSLTVYNALEELRKSKETDSKKIADRKIKIEQLENYIKDPLEREIMCLPDTERFILVLNKIETYSIDEVSDLLSIAAKETIVKVENAAGRIMSAMPSLESNENLFQKLHEITKVHTPDKSVVDSIYSEVYQKRVEEVEKRKALEKPEPEQPAEEDDKEILEEKKKSREKKKQQIEKKEKTKSEKPEEKKELVLKPSFDFSKLKKLIVPLIVIILIIALISLLFSGGDSWEVIIKKGTIVIDSEFISENTSLSAGQSVLTSEGSYATVSVPGFGDINLDPLSSLQRLDQKNSVRLNTGIIRMIFSNDEESFRLEVPAAVITDFNPGYLYEVDLNHLGNSRLSINKGWLKVSGINNEIIAGPDCIVEIRHERGCGLPYHYSSSSEVIGLINNISFQAMEFSIPTLVENSGQKEVITLWNLFKNSNRGVRELIFNKLDALVPHPPNYSKNSLLTLNEDGMNLWLKIIMQQTAK